MNNLFVIGIFLDFFLVFLLLVKQKKTLPDKILIAWMLVIGIHISSYYLYNLNLWEKYPHLVGITHPVPLLHGPLLYLYVTSSLREEQKLRWIDYAHFTPALIAYLGMVPFFFFYSAEKKSLVNHHIIDDYQTFMSISLLAFIISGITYPILAFRLIDKHEKLIHENFSFEEKISLSWLRYCLFGLLVIFLTVMIFSVVQNVIKIQLPFNPDYIYYSEIIMFIFFLGFYGIKHEGIFTDSKPASVVTKSSTKKAGSYKKSGLKNNEAELLHQKLLNTMMEKKPYLDPKLTLNKLADEIGVTTNYLSQIINQYQNKNFYDFVNSYRVEEFKSLIEVPKNKHLSILAIALDSGFNSKSSFNMVFKKLTGMTPSQFLAENK